MNDQETNDVFLTMQSHTRTSIHELFDAYGVCVRETANGMRSP
jgi:hypothetical protein